MSGRPITLGDLAYLRRPSCFLCKHYSIGHCELYDEEIDSELFAAAHCDSYQPVRHG